ncbi:hypothetical protein OAU50_03025 [Planctomycetota bacterium]|nr:hypothetical protein [Planctomycetota bacterium]
MGQIIALIGFVLLFLSFASMFASGSKGLAWRYWGLVFSTIGFVVTLGRTGKPRFGQPDGADPEDWDNKTLGMIFGRYDGTFANYELREELEFKRKMLAEGKDPGPITSGKPKMDYIKSLGQVNDVARENREALAEIEDDSGE